MSLRDRDQEEVFFPGIERAFCPSLFRQQRSGQKWKADKGRKRFCQTFTTTARYTVVNNRLKVLESQFKLHSPSTLSTSDEPKLCIYRHLLVPRTHSSRLAHTHVSNGCSPARGKTQSFSFPVWVSTSSRGNHGSR